MSATAEQCRALRASRKAEGLCMRCGKKPAVPYANCRPCRLAISEDRKRRYWEAKQR